MMDKKPFYRVISNNLPPIEKWKITLCDIHVPDQELLSEQEQQQAEWVKTLQKVPLPPIDLDGSIIKGTFHPYIKAYNGKKWLRMELEKEQPDSDIASFTTSYIEEVARYKFEEALLRVLRRS